MRYRKRPRPKHVIQPPPADFGLGAPSYAQPRRGLTLSVSVPLPRPIALRARREVYTYPLPSQLRLKRRTLRQPLPLYRGPYINTRVRIRLPARLPTARGSYVSINRGRLNIHSYNALKRLFAAGELNRRRYSEHKSNRRHARNGQLDSPGSGAFGIVARLAASGAPISRIADGALVARAILKGGV